MTEILIIGAGAIGSFVASSCMQSGCQVSLVGRGERLEQIKAQGLVVEGQVRVAAEEFRPLGWDESFAPTELVILCTKTNDLPDTLESLSDILAGTESFLTLQNGVEAPDLVAECFPQATVVAGRVHGFFKMQDAKIHHIGVEPSILFGRTSGENVAAEQVIGEVLSKAGVKHRLSENIRLDLWEKFLLVSSLGGSALAMNMPAGQLSSNEEGAALLRSAMEDIALLGRCVGNDLPEDCVDRAMEFVVTFPPDATTSLQRDVLSGDPSEYEALIGAALRIADLHNIRLHTIQKIDALCRLKMGVSV